MALPLAADVAVRPATAMVTAAAATAAAPLVIPFPSPTAGPTEGRFHTLPSLQCRVHPAASEGVSPDSATVVNPYGQGGTGWLLRANATAKPVVILYGAGTCSSPLNDGFHLSYLAAPDQMGQQWTSIPTNTTLPSDGDPDADYTWVGNAFFMDMTSAAMREPAFDRRRRSEYYQPLQCANATSKSGLVCEEELIRLLSLHRNQEVGRIDRQRALYDVLTIGRMSLGMVLDTHVRVVAAQDIVSGASGIGAEVPIVTYTGQDGVTLPVIAGDAALLSLGRGIMADPSWLGDSFPGNLSARVRLYEWHPGKKGPSREWSLRHGTDATQSSFWLQDVANVLCASPSSSFVADSTYCDGVDHRDPPRHGILRAGGRPVPASRRFATELHSGETEIGMKWTLLHRNQAVVAESCPPGDARATVKRPLWLLGRGDRELHTTGPAGGAEVDLARRLSSCAYNGSRNDVRLP